MLASPRARTAALPARGARQATSCVLSIVLLLFPTFARPRDPGQENTPPEAAEELSSIHYQATVASQWHPSFAARYSGPNSLQTKDETATSIVADLFAGLRLWQGGEGYLQPEIAGGRGLSSTQGVAAFPSGEAARVGNPAPTIFVGRAFLRQTVGFGGGSVRVEAGQNQLAGTRDRDTLTLTLGKVATTDLIDNVPFSNDPHTSFESWGLWASAAYDYPADTHGFTYGVAADLSVDWWSARAGMFLEPRKANALQLDFDLSRASGLAGEVEGRHSFGERAGAIRMLAFLNTANMGSYRDALAESPNAPDVTATRARDRTKAGFAASANQELSEGLGAFLRVSYNDGNNESWAFTEIDRSVSAGVVQTGSPWKRPEDQAGIGVVVSGLSAPHREYLAAGGKGFLLGDGRLSYAPEVLVEAYYRLALTHEVSVGASYQPIFNPAYNRDRGPVEVLTGRVHVQF